MSEIMHLTRDYEVSVWTLQDSFITVLGASNEKYCGRIQNPEMKLVNDGTQEFTFSIPMYLDDGINRIKNPIWTDIYNASTIAGMRKIKVIFNRCTDDEAVFEFLITKVTKSHEKDKPQCDVQCEGLAFHELGKIGYKKEFSTDVLVEENYQWYINGQIGIEPNPTMDYWNQTKLGLEPYPIIANSLPATFDGYRSNYLIGPVSGIYTYYTWDKENNIWKEVCEAAKPNDVLDATKWYYKVDMDWSSYANNIHDLRESFKIYDEEYTVAWDTDLLPKDVNSIVQYREKTRTLDEKESNIYNLTQKLAETFGVFCRYEYGYDDNYHIISRTIVYYNSGIKEKNRKLSFTYPYSSTKISREDDCTDIVTKMYVTAVEDATTDSGIISITASDANPTKEDYLLNFDYLKSIDTITQEQYDEIAKYNKKIRQINDELVPLSNQLLVKQDRLPKVEALAKTAENAKALDVERMNNAKRLKDGLTNSEGNIVRSGANAKSVVLLAEDSNNSSFYFTAPESGILVHTITLYQNFANGVLTNPVATLGTPEYDEFGNFTKMVSIPRKLTINGATFDLGLAARRTFYMTYTYSPQLYYQRIEDTWRKRLAKDEADYITYSTEQKQVKQAIDTLEAALAEKREEKEMIVKQFEQMMGPALREGYWTPDNYNVNAGEKYTDTLTLKRSDLGNGNISDYGDSKHSTLLWDIEKFDDEQEEYYRLGVQQQPIYYTYIELNDTQYKWIQDELTLPVDESHPIGILYFDYEGTEISPHQIAYYRTIAIGGGAQLSFIQNEGIIKPILLLTGITNFTNEELNHLKSSNSSARLGYLQTNINNDGTVTISALPSNINLSIIDSAQENSQWHVLNEPTPLVYPRCKIDSLALKTSETNLNISYNSEALKEFEDYYVFQRVDIVDNSIESNYYITFKPETIFKKYNDNNPIGNNIIVRFVLSSASTAVYLDAREVLKENSKPKVTYSVDPSVFYEDFIYTDYNSLNTIAFINDFELEFDGAQGYISEVDLNLDFPGEDKLEIKNYKNKFEDLFATIVAQTQAMEKNEGLLANVSKAIGADGAITGSALQGALKKVDLNYAFNNGKLTISEKDGIWGTSDDGVVAYRGGGIFTATQKDSDGNWIWNTGIVPQGINAELITAGQLDTNKVMVYAGDRLRFQLNGDGLFAYKSFLSDYITNSGNNNYNTMMNARTTDIDYGQYLVVNEDGLFLKAAQGSYVLKASGDDYKVLSANVTRVSISWDGLKLRNWENEDVFYAEADTGNLYATKLTIGSSNGKFMANGTSFGFYDNNTRPIFTIDSNGYITSSKPLYISASNLIIGTYNIYEYGNANFKMSDDAIWAGVQRGSQSTSLKLSSNSISLTASGESTSTFNLSTEGITMVGKNIVINGGHVLINGQQEWSRSDIIYGNPMPTPPASGSFIWIKPIASSQWAYNKTGSDSEAEGHPKLARQVKVTTGNSDSYAPTGCSSYSYSVTFTVTKYISDWVNYNSLHQVTINYGAYLADGSGNFSYRINLGTTGFFTIVSEGSRSFTFTQSFTGVAANSAPELVANSPNMYLVIYAVDNNGIPYNGYSESTDMLLYITSATVTVSASTDGSGQFPCQVYYFSR